MVLEHRGGRRRWITGLLLILALVVPGCGTGDGQSAGTTISGGGGGFTSTITEPATAQTGVTDSPVDTPPVSTDIAQFSDLPPVLVTELPGEALDTLDLIAAGGPFPFDRDGLTFQNREGLLPDRPLGHYREFTVVTPGESTRGARRIVAGDTGELYYTDDHYQSFFEIIPED